MKLSIWLSLTIIVLLSLFLLTRQIHKPFWGHHDFNSNIWTVVAKNNLAHGLACTKLGQSTTAYPITDCRQLGFYQNHPPLITWALTASYAAFGFPEWAGRLPFVLASTGSALLMFLIGKRLKSPLVGLTASLFFMATPMFQYFGKAINHEPATLFTVLLASFSLISWLQTKQKGWYRLFLASALLTGLTGWHGYLAYPFFTAAVWLTNRNKAKKTLLAWLILLATFSAHQLHTKLVTGSFNVELFSQFLTRIGLTSTDTAQAQIVGFSYPKFFLQEARWLTIYLTRFLPIGTALYLGSAGLTFIRNKQLEFRHLFTLALLGFGASIPFIFAQQAFIHDYLNFYLLPGMALATTLVFERLSHSVPKIWQPFLIGLVTVGIFLERYPFLQSLQRGEAERAFVDLANQIIPYRGSPQTRFLIEAGNFYNFAYPALWNYAYGTVIDNRNDTLKSFQDQEDIIVSGYDYLITVSTHPGEVPFQEYLQATYPSEVNGTFTFYKLPTMPVKTPKS